MINRLTINSQTPLALGTRSCLPFQRNFQLDYSQYIYVIQYIKAKILYTNCCLWPSSAFDFWDKGGLYIDWLIVSWLDNRLNGWLVSHYNINILTKFNSDNPIVWSTWVNLRRLPLISGKFPVLTVCVHGRNIKGMFQFQVIYSSKLLHIADEILRNSL